MASMKLHQFSCVEGKKIDLRQANAVLRYRPDIIIFEAPTVGKTSSLIYNKYKPPKKPLAQIAEHKKMLRKLGAKAPWVLSDIYVYENIVKLWKEGKDVMLYNVDGPSDLLRVNLKLGAHWNPSPYRRGTHFSWWVRIYLRDTIMMNNIRKILTQTKVKDPTVLVFLQSFHWRNIKFLMKNPTQEQIYKYYFGAFKETHIKTINERVKKDNKILYKYWKKVSCFKNKYK